MDDLSFRGLLREIPAWIKVFVLLYFVGLLGVGYVGLHFIMKFW